MAKEITIASIERILKKMGAERVSNKGKKVLRDYIESYTEKLADKIVRITLHAKRITVREDDIELAIE